MDRALRNRLARAALDGYVNGPDASTIAAAEALDHAETARAAVLVEGISDQIALETLATLLGRDLHTEGVAVVPMGGAQEITRHLAIFGPLGRDLRVTGMCDAAEEPLFRNSLAAAGLGTAHSRSDLEALGFYTCVDDLEQELIRASGPERIEQVLRTQGDHGSFRTLQRQPAWRDRPFDEQFHRWLRAGSRRHLRYARLLTEITPVDRAPRPLEAVLAASRP